MKPGIVIADEGDKAGRTMAGPPQAFARSWRTAAHMISLNNQHRAAARWHAILRWGGAIVVMSLCLPLASARTGYLLRGAPAPLAIEPTTRQPWDALAGLPPLDLGNTTPTNALAATSNPSVASGTVDPAALGPVLSMAPGFEKETTVSEPTAVELLSRLLSSPGGTNLVSVLPGPVSFVPPAPPSSSATYLQTKP